jgi:hypothetical protein
MDSGRIRADNISLTVDGKTIELKNLSKQNGQLNEALRDPAQFQDFAQDPKAFAARYNLAIDESISSALRGKLTDIKSIEQGLSALGSVGSDRATTVWAVVQGVYSVASSKVAVAFVPVDLLEQIEQIQQLQEIQQRGMR